MRSLCDFVKGVGGELCVTVRLQTDESFSKEGLPDGTELPNGHCIDTEKSFSPSLFL